KAVDQNFEGVLESVEVLLLRAVFRRSHAGLRLEPERAQIGEQMAKDLELVCRGPAIELEHDRGIERGDIAMPDVTGDAGEEDRGVTALEAAHHRHFRNGMALPVIFAEKERVDPGRVPAHDHVLIIVGKNLRLDEITWAEETGDGPGFAHRAERALPKTFAARTVFALEIFSG